MSTPERDERGTATEAGEHDDLEIVIDLTEPAPSPSRRQRLGLDDPVALVGRATLFVALVNARDSATATAIAALATLLLFLEPRRMRAPWPWLVLGLALGVEQWFRWWELENHVIATTAWAVLFGLVRLADDPARTLHLAARLFIAVIFLFATGWKVASSQYTSNDFFAYTLAADHRFEPVADLAGGGDPEALVETRRALAELEPGDTVVLHEGPRHRTVAGVASIFGLAAEALIAVAFLFDRRWARRIRPWSLLVFCAFTYAVVPVVGFGALVLTAGAACFEGRTQRRAIAGVAVLVAWGLVVGQLVG